MFNPLRPVAEGVSTGTQFDANGFINKHELRLGNAESLLALSAEYTFFTPAILYLYGRFRDAPLFDFVHMVQPAAKFYYKKFSKPIFKGLEARSDGNADWNFVLWAIQKEYWSDFSAWMVSLTLTYQDSQDVAGIGEQHLEIIDPLAHDKMFILQNTLPCLPISAFGINSNVSQIGLFPGKRLTQDLPYLVMRKPTETMKVFAAALYGGANPFDVIAWQKTQKLKENDNEDQIRP